MRIITTFALTLSLFGFEGFNIDQIPYVKEGWKEALRRSEKEIEEVRTMNSNENDAAVRAMFKMREEKLEDQKRRVEYQIRATKNRSDRKKLESLREFLWEIQIPFEKLDKAIKNRKENLRPAMAGVIIKKSALVSRLKYH